MEILQEISDRLISHISTSFKRSLYSEINWNSRLIEIRGARGTGKTTLMLQRAKELQEQGKNVLYVSIDHAYFYQNQLLELADYYYKYGGEYLFVDEVHKYPQKVRGLDWSLEIKNIYDSYPELSVVYSGSSILQLYKGRGDLSRRKSTYHLYGLSFREFIEFEFGYSMPKISLPDIFSKHRQISKDITSQIKVLPAFKQYLRIGYYPFYKENSGNFYDRLNDIANVILETDIPTVTDIRFETAYKFKTLLGVLASHVPYAPNLSKLSGQLYITDYRTMLKYLNYLEKAELIQTLGAHATGNQLLNKPDKIYLNNTNLMHAFALQEINKGTLRETFVMNQLIHSHALTYPKSGDFLIDGYYTLEIGGKNKTQKQIVNINNAFIAKDEIETGMGNSIPLWIFGFLY